VVDVLDVSGLTTTYHTERGPLRALEDVDLSIEANETYGLVGESGAGKSTVARAVMGMIDEPGEITSGDITYRGRDLRGLSEKEFRDVRGAEIAMIFQDPSEALNPVLTVGEQLKRAVRYNDEENRSEEELENDIVEMMETVHIPDPASRLDDYPVQFSGGMSQRVMIAMALLCDPDLLIADEPTTNLDVTIGAHILELLDDIQAERDLSIVFITHNMGIVANHCDRVGIMYAGRKVEEGPIERVFDDPHHPYTRDLLECIPRPDLGDVDRLTTIEGTMPTPIELPDTCYYANRCPMATDECWERRPQLEQTRDKKDHSAACYYSEDVA